MTNRWDAAKDLWEKYRRAFALVWTRRNEMQPQERSNDERAFLPAVLALTETPVSPAPRLVMALIVIFVVVAVIWAIAGKVDIVAVAPGKIIPGDRVKTIQPLETSVIAAIHVVDGQRVKRGDVLVELDPTESSANRKRLDDDLLMEEFAAVRAQAMLSAISSGEPPKYEGHGMPSVSDDRLEEEHEILDGEFAEFVSRRQQHDAQIERSKAERMTVKEDIAKLRELLPIINQRVADYKELLNKEYVSKHSYLELEQQRITAARDLAVQKARLVEIDAAINEAIKSRAALVAEARRIQLERLNAANRKIAALQQELVKAVHRSQLTQLRSPVDGAVQQLAVHTVGGVAPEAQPLMVIVPAEDTLEVEALIANKDIGFVEVGHNAQVKIDTFPFTKYGVVSGEIVTISGDAIQNEELGLMYVARIKLQRDAIQIGRKWVNLTSGMAVTAEIQTGKRRLVEYFLNPLMQYKHDSLRER